MKARASLILPWALSGGLVLGVMACKGQSSKAGAEVQSARQSKGMGGEVPAAIRLQVKLRAEVATDRQRAGDLWMGSLAEAANGPGGVAWPIGTEVRGVVTQSVPAGRLSASGGLALKLTRLGECPVESGTYAVAGAPRAARDAQYVGSGAALGGLAGLLSGKPAVGRRTLGAAAAGAAAGTVVAAGTADAVVRIPMGEPLVFLVPVTAGGAGKP